MTTYSKLLFDRGQNAQKGRPNLNDLLFINTSFFNLFLPLLLTAVMRWIPQANHLVFGQLEGQDPIYSTLLIGMATIFHMLIYMRQTYFYESRGDRSVSFKVINQVAFILPLAIWLLAISINYPTAHVISIGLCMILLFLVSLSVSTRSKHNPFKNVLHEPKINRLILVALILFGLIFMFFLIKFEEISGKERLPTWVLIFIIFTFLVTVLVNEFNRRKYHPQKTIRQSIFQNSTVNAIYIILGVIIAISVLGGYDKFGNAFDILILYLLFVRIVLFCLGVLIRYIINAPSLQLFNVKFIAIIVVCYIIGFLSRPYKGRDHYRLETFVTQHSRMSIEAYVDRWLEHTPADKPIYLVAGQGGGSRAGCAFFTTMSLLDSLLDHNTLAIATISGSSNGAGFYLGIKKAIPLNTSYTAMIAPKDTNRIKVIDSILYQKDYISNSLFKLLFSDYARSLFAKGALGKSRNMGLMHEELKAYRQVRQYLGLDPITLLDSNWTDMYNAASDPAFPLFMPVSYNIEQGVKAINSPVRMDSLNFHPYFSIPDSLGPFRDLHINQSILLSEIFPVISASASIDGYHYLDGGIYDNLAYESLFDLYQFVSEKRDQKYKARPIILLSIINGNYEDPLPKDHISTEIAAIINGLSQSLFSTNPVVHEFNGLNALDPVKDRFYELRVYQERIPKPSPSVLQRFIDFFRYTPDKDKVILSRYLTADDINHNIVRSTYREVDSLKRALQIFFDSKH